jgi:hypothetical protein
VPFFFKQWGGVRKKLTGRRLEGRTHNEFPTLATGPVADLAARRAALERFEAAAGVV